jgi:thymidylate synthase ThyX
MSLLDPETLFHELDGSEVSGIAAIQSPVHHSPNGVPYLLKPGVVVLARPEVNLDGLAGFLDGFDETLHFLEYLDDPTILPHGAQLCKVAGQTCYMSFGRGRTFNAHTARYFDNLKSSGHGSVLEHANFSLLLYGVSRSVTHELVRHRAGMSYCLTGDTLIYSSKWDHGKPNGSKKRRLDDLYAMTETHHGRSRIKLLRLRCLDEETGTFTTGKVKSIVRSGVKPVFTVTLADGKTITATKEHRFLTKDGWLPLGEIVGSLSVSRSGFAVYEKLDAEIMVNGQPMYKDAEWLHEHYVVKKLSQEDIASIAGVSKHTIRAWIGKHGLQKPMGSWTIGVSPWNTGKQYQTGTKKSEEERTKLSERMKGEGNHRWKGGTTAKGVVLRRGVEDLRSDIYARDNHHCRLCGKRGGRLSIHHILPAWARPDLVCDPENMVTLCRSCHLKVNNHEEDYIEVFGRRADELGDISRPVVRKPRLVPKPMRIVAITYAGEQMTYDIEMERPHHNFVANGIVSHNSQVSQRYVSGRVLRFVERPEYAQDEQLHSLFLQRIERAASEYAALTNRLVELQQAGSTILSAEARTDLLKKVRQSARSALPNETEAPIVVTGNGRSWRHVIEMRADAHAEVEIRELAVRIFLCLRQTDPVLFSDYMVEELPDGTHTVKTEFRKV